MTINFESIAILLTSYNRKDRTIGCLRALDCAQRACSAIKFSVYLVDAGSTDGTREAIDNEFGDYVSLIEVESDVFWNRGMHIAFKNAVCQDHDAYLWMNDDTIIFEDSINRILETVKTLKNLGRHPGVLVGCVNDPRTNDMTYGGLNHVSRFNPLKLQRVGISISPQKVDTMNGNCVFVTGHAASTIGNLDWAFVHSMGDVDYGLRAKKLGVEIWTVPGVVGHCARNPIDGSWQDPKLSFYQRWRKLLGPKGLPVKSWLVLTKRHGGLLWPVVFLKPYLELISNNIFQRDS